MMRLENERKTWDKYSLSINNVLADITHNYWVFRSFYDIFYEKGTGYERIWL